MKTYLGLSAMTKKPVGVHRKEPRHFGRGLTTISARTPFRDIKTSATGIKAFVYGMSLGYDSFKNDHETLHGEAVLQCILDCKPAQT